jgi:plastocyanin
MQMLYKYGGSRMSVVLQTLLICTALAALAGRTASEGAARPKTHTVTIHGMQFVPANLEVNLGDTVIWQNEDLVPHTATSAKRGFDSGAIEPGGSWKYVVNKKGSYSYICVYHPTMKAGLIVR